MIGVFFSLFLILLISSASSQDASSCSEKKDFSVYNLNKETCVKYTYSASTAEYTYALGVGRDDDTDTGGCTAEEDATLDPESMIIGQIKDGNNLKLKIYGHSQGLFDNCAEYINDGFLCNLPSDTYKYETCGWNLPLSKEGCYFLAQEHDPAPDMPPDRKTDDCMGWKIPLGTTIDTTAGKLTGESILQKISSTAFSDQKFSKFFDETDLFSGDWSPADDGDALCIMKKLFGLKNAAYLCSANPSGEAVWFICDSDYKGKFIKKDDTTNYLCEESSTGFKWTPTTSDCENIKKMGGDCDTDMIACVNTYTGGQEIKEGTIIGGSAWNKEAQAGEENKCCGDDGTEDLNKLSKDEQHICSNNQITEEVLTYGGKTGKTLEQVKKDIKENYKEGWKWVKASDEPFKIILKIGDVYSWPQFNFDIISNGNYWFTCNKEGKLSDSGIEGETAKSMAHRFFCSGNEYRGFWKECLPGGVIPDSGYSNRQALIGDNIYTLYPQEKSLISPEGQSLEIDKPIEYREEAMASAGTENADSKITFKFTEDPYLNLVTGKLPEITISGFSQKNDFTSDNLIDYLEVPYLEKDRTLTALVPAPGNPSVQSKIAAGTLFKIYQSGKNLFCSGKEVYDEEGTAWITDLDDKTKIVAGGKTACEANGYTWTGTKCCGDDAIKMTESLEDFYADDGMVTGADEEGKPIFDETKPRGCWAGVPLKDGESIGEIKFTISAGGKTLEETYPCKKETGKECRYFIKGIVTGDKIIEKITLTNLYPERYELVAKPSNKLGENQNLKDIKITGEGVEVDRNKYYLEAKNVPAMAIVGKDEEGNSKFLTCGIDLSGMGANKVLNMPLCTTSGDNYCSAQGWTNKAPAKFNFNAETKEYEPTEEAYEPAVFNHSGSVVFGRNLIPNAGFGLDEKGNLNNWQKVNQGAIKVEKEKLLVQGKFVSSPLYLEKDSYLLSFTSNCDSNDFFDMYLSDNPSPDDVTGPKLKIPLPKEYTEHGEWRHYYEYSPEAGKYWLKLFSQEKECSLGELTLYRNQGTLTPFNYDALHQPITAQQCCPENTCWNGFTCAEDMSLQTEREETVAEGVSYRCLKGNWTAQEKKWDWANKVQGYCEKESQCFVAPITPTGDAQGAIAGMAAGEFYKGTTPSCVNDTEFIFDHYCKEGEWTTRTKFLIESLQSLAKKNDYPKYILYCSPYTETLNEYGSSVYDVEQFIGGGQDYSKTSIDKGCQFKKDDPACQTAGKLCFSGANSNLVPNEENTCVNNFCILTHEEDKQQKTIFAVSLNQPIDDTSNSFLRSLSIDTPDEIQNYCPKEGNDWVDCQNKVGFLKYNPKLNLVAYSSEEFEFEPGTLAKLWTGVKDAVGGAIDFIGGLFGVDIDKVEPGQLPELLKDKTATTAFTACPGIDTSRYFSFFGEGKSAVACVWNNTLSASYYNFVTPMCAFANHTLEEKKKITQEETTETIPPQGQSAYLCSEEDTPKLTHLKITNPNNFAFWWPQLTGRLRVN